MPPPDPPIAYPCPACGLYCRSVRDCLERTNNGQCTSGASRRLVLTELGWKLSKYGRDPRKDPPC
jgi:hypothetical protein